MELRCVKCGHRVEKLYIQYSPGNIRLVKCEKCGSIADEYVECELMILIVDLILHRPKAYRHLLFNLLGRKTLNFDVLLIKSSLIFLILDAYKLWIMNAESQEWSLIGIGLKVFASTILGNVVILCVLFALSRFLDFAEGYHGYKDVLLAMIISSYLKAYMLAMVVWQFPASVVDIIDLFVMSSNMVALMVITESSFKACAGVCLAAHGLNFFVNWMF